MRSRPSGRPNASGRATAPAGNRAVLTLLAVLAILAAPRAATAQSDIGLDLGATPEPVTIEDLDGEPFDLGRVVGQRPVLIEFWATWCPVCEELHPDLVETHEWYGDRVEFIQIAVGVNQSPRSIRRHLEEHPSPARVLWDGRGRATRAFQVPTTSYIVVLDADGRVVYTGAGAHQDLEAAVRTALDDGLDDGER
ncbi:MAG: TlpA family protein disulfide reductase [Gemmatimonadota bacterium]